jgi:XTP/dITP diphosphohydrolase
MMAAGPWVLASRNAGKLRELRALFATHGIRVVDLTEAGVEEDPVTEEAIEAFETYEENALAKARYFASVLPGRIVVADDSGLSVDALAGAPGVRSKRWSGVTGATAEVDAANNAKLIAQVRNAPTRVARFVCAAAWSDGVHAHVARGAVVGRIVDVPAGSHGFGYDPHVFVDELGMTMAEASIAEKQRVSHRARAFEALLRVLRDAGMLTGA